jgi:acyl-coenzyme A synthetase/AMP-(fatty) acid ligase
MVSIPLVRKFAPGAAFALRAQGTVSVEAYLQDVQRLAACLPPGRFLLNLCADRYRFAVAFGAALVRGQINLLPPDKTAHTIAEIDRGFRDVYALVDGAETGLPVLMLNYPVLGAGSVTARDIPAVPADRIAAIGFSSGTTGQPVPHRKSWGALVRDASGDALCVWAQIPRAAVIATVPPQHVYGLEFTVLMVMQNGLVLDAGRPFYPADVAAALSAARRPRILVTTPVHLRALLADDAPLPAVDCVLCATAPLAPQLAARAEARVAAPLYEIYGCTEAGRVATRRTVETAEWQLFPDLALREDTAGTWVSGGHVESKVLLNDVVEPRGRRRFLLHGRLADLVNVAGKRTSLASLNFHLNSIAGVHDGTFVVPADEGDGTVRRLSAFVVAPGLDREVLLDALRARIDEAFMPRPLHFVDALPRSAAGKLPRRSLDALAGWAANQAGQA